MEEWFYEKNGEQFGPVSREALRGLRMASEIVFTNLVWKEGMKDWAPYGEVFSAEGEGGSKLTLGMQKCPNCGVSVRHKDLIPAGEKIVCPSCRDDYAQSLKEGLTGPESESSERHGTGGMTPNREIRAMARAALSGRWGYGALAVFITTAVNMAVGIVPFLGPFVQIAIGGPIMAGLLSYFLSISRDDPVEIGEVFSGFSTFGKAFGLYLVVAILTFLAIFGAAIPGTLLVSFAGMSVETGQSEPSPLLIFGIVLVILPIIVVGIFMVLRYSMIFFILRDAPELSISETIKASVEMTRGHKKKLFFLYLSFIGWLILGMLAFYIGIFWVTAYMYTALAAFYDDIADEG